MNSFDRAAVWSACQVEKFQLIGPLTRQFRKQFKQQFKQQFKKLALLAIAGFWLVTSWLMVSLPVYADDVYANSIAADSDYADSDYAAHSDGFLNLTDLPSGFVAASGAEVESCQMAGKVSAFVLERDQTLVEKICVSSFSIAAATETAAQADAIRQIYDALLQNPQSLTDQARAMGVEDIQILDSLQGIGEVVAGFSKTEPDIGKTDVTIFRRGDRINSVLVRYPIGHEPIVPLKSVARKVDQHVSQK